MADKKNINKHKQSLLTELESIKDLLANSEEDNIPTLQEPIIETQVEVSKNDQTEEQLEDYTAHRPDVLPGQQSLFRESLATESLEQTSSSVPLPTELKKELRYKDIANNPFLPDQLKNRIEQEAASATNIALEAKQTPPTNNPLTGSTYTERIIDQLVAHYMPKIEADLRKRLAAVAKLHEQRLKK